MESVTIPLLLKMQKWWRIYFFCLSLFSSPGTDNNFVLSCE